MKEKHDFQCPFELWSLEKLEEKVAQLRIKLENVASIALQENGQYYMITLVSCGKISELLLPRAQTDKPAKTRATMTTVGDSEDWSYRHFLHQGAILHDLGLIGARTN